ncbi:ABC transporter ATP-binding protein [Candidatus Atribacteria bacterium 1244-E10-H5-B2]|nr:MAG: ABC transporter ATP-binding protein [Candidatus Atribacteria bacterium 1244-E10-H5-B2]
MNNALLEVHNVTKRFGGLTANKDISFNISKGQITGLIGPNGAGKTTLFNLITGTAIEGYSRLPDEGHVIFKGNNITGLKPNSICKQGMVRTFQNSICLDSMTALGNVMIGALVRTSLINDAKKKAVKYLETVGLKDKRNIISSNFTVADKKKLEIARALATEPELLLLDEPMSGLTPLELKEEVNLIKDINQKGITIFIIEHVMEALMPIADYIIVLDSGEKIASGTPKEVVKNSKVTKAYMGVDYAIIS